MNIGEAATATGMSTKTLRYYESIGLILPARHENGYRDYSAQDLRELAFLRRVRMLDFSLDECGELLNLYRNPQRQSREVHEKVAGKIAALQNKIDDLQMAKSELEKLMSQCPNDESPACAIIQNLSGGEAQ